jgi:ribonuclease III
MFTDLEQRLGYTFKDVAHLRVALTHRSFHSERKDKSESHNERYEFLGDAVLDLVLSQLLMSKYPEAGEGSLSKWRASLVNETQLAEIARQLDLSKYLFLGRSEDNVRHQGRPRLLASALEAILAAIYLDGGLEDVKTTVHKLFSASVDGLAVGNEFAADCKTRLQEWSQKRYHTTPEYALINADGPEHAKTFQYQVKVNGEVFGLGQGASRKAAEQEAARAALAKLLQASTELSTQNIQLENVQETSGDHA